MSLFICKWMCPVVHTRWNKSNKFHGIPKINWYFVMIKLLVNAFLVEHIHIHWIGHFHQSSELIVDLCQWISSICVYFVICICFRWTHWFSHSFYFKNSEFRNKVDIGKAWTINIHLIDLFWTDTKWNFGNVLRSRPYSFILHSDD